MARNAFFVIFDVATDLLKREVPIDVFQNGRWQPFCVLIWNAIENDFRSSKMANLWTNYLIKCCVLIWNGEKCDQRWFSVIQNSRHGHFVKKCRSQPFCGCLTALLISFVIRVLSLIDTNWPYAIDVSLIADCVGISLTLNTPYHVTSDPFWFIAEVTQAHIRKLPPLTNMTNFLWPGMACHWRQFDWCEQYLWWCFIYAWYVQSVLLYRCSTSMC